MATNISSQNNALESTTPIAPGPPKESSNLLQMTEEFDDDIFEDASDDTSTIQFQEVGLEQSFKDCDIAINKFFNNDLEGAMAIMKPWSHSSLYHSLGLAIFEFIPAMLTFDRIQIKSAAAAVKKCLIICLKNRKHYSFAQSVGSFIKKPNYSAYTDLEAHAELCYAEAMLLQAAMCIVEHEDVTGLVAGLVKIRSCYNTYQSCWDIKEMKVWDTESSEVHFKSGVRLGTATFNLMISQLPQKAVTILEFVGFTGNKYYALSELEKGSRSPGMRSLLCDLTLLAYHYAICPYLGGRGNLKFADTVLQKCLASFPDSVWFIAFLARSQIVTGKIDEAISSYKQAIHNHPEFKQFRLLCYWELMWAEGLSSNYEEAANYADLLLEESSWSRTTHSYIKAAMMLQGICERELTKSYKDNIDELMSLAPTYKMRLAGKSLPMEKFVIRRCNRYQKQQSRLVLPGLEIMCLWNLFPNLTDNQYLVQNILKTINKTEESLKADNNEWMGPYRHDNYALVHFLKGCALLVSQAPRQALEQFDLVIQLKGKIKEDAFLVPFAVCEKAMCYFQLDDIERAMFYLNEARKRYSGYNLESRLLLRVHARIDMVKEIMDATEFQRN